MGVLASAQFTSQGSICSIGMGGVRADLCLRRLIGHPVMCDSRGLEKLSDLTLEMGPLTLQVGKHGHYLLIASSHPNSPLSECDIHDPRQRLGTRYKMISAHYCEGYDRGSEMTRKGLRKPRLCGMKTAVISQAKAGTGSFVFLVPPTRAW